MNRSFIFRIKRLQSRPGNAANCTHPTREDARYNRSDVPYQWRPHLVAFIPNIHSIGFPRFSSVFDIRHTADEACKFCDEVILTK